MVDMKTIIQKIRNEKGHSVNVQVHTVAPLGFGAGIVLRLA
jgi:hypothetical protein